MSWANVQWLLVNHSDHLQMWAHPCFFLASVAENVLTPPVLIDGLNSLAECIMCEMGIQIFMAFGSLLVSAVVFTLALVHISLQEHLPWYHSDPCSQSA